MVIVYYFHFRRRDNYFAIITRNLFFKPVRGLFKKMLHSCFSSFHPLLRLCLLNPMPRAPIYLTFIYVGGGGDCMSLRRTSCCQEDISYVCNNNNNIKTGYTSLEKLMPLMRETKQKNHTISTCFCFSKMIFDRGKGIGFYSFR